MGKQTGERQGSWEQLLVDRVLIQHAWVKAIPLLPLGRAAWGKEQQWKVHRTMLGHLFTHSFSTHFLNAHYVSDTT